MELDIHLVQEMWESPTTIGQLQTCPFAIFTPPTLLNLLLKRRSINGLESTNFLLADRRGAMNHLRVVQVVVRKCRAKERGPFPARKEKGASCVPRPHISAVPRLHSALSLLIEPLTHEQYHVFSRNCKNQKRVMQLLKILPAKVSETGDLEIIDRILD